MNCAGDGDVMGGVGGNTGGDGGGSGIGVDGDPPAAGGLMPAMDIPPPGI